MAKIKALMEDVKKAVEYKSIRDFGYSVAGKTDAVRADGAWALDNIRNFLTEPAKDDINELKEGFRLRYAANNPEVDYAVVDGNYIPKDQLPADAKVLESVKIGVAYAFSFTQQAYGALKNDDLKKYQIIQDLRDKVNKYTSGCLSDLKAAARKVEKQRNPDSNTRAATLAFYDFIDKSFDAWKQRCKSAEARGNDPTADSDALNAAIVAFKVKYELNNKQ
jgi:hypothetical protein